MRVYQFRHVGTELLTLLQYQALTFFARSTFVRFQRKTLFLLLLSLSLRLAALAEETEIIAEGFQKSKTLQRARSLLAVQIPGARFAAYVRRIRWQSLTLRLPRIKHST